MSSGSDHSSIERPLIPPTIRSDKHFKPGDTGFAYGVQRGALLSQFVVESVIKVHALGGGPYIKLVNQDSQGAGFEHVEYPMRDSRLLRVSEFRWLHNQLTAGKLRKVDALYLALIQQAQAGDLAAIAITAYCEISIEYIRAFQPNSFLKAVRGAVLI